MKTRIKNNGEAKQALDELRVLKRDARFCELLDLARDGDENAVGDLWREFQFSYEQDAA